MPILQVFKYIVSTSTVAKCKNYLRISTSILKYKYQSTLPHTSKNSLALLFAQKSSLLGVLHAIGTKWSIPLWSHIQYQQLHHHHSSIITRWSCPVTSNYQLKSIGLTFWNSTTTKRQLYLSLVRSKLTPIWQPHRHILLERVQRQTTDSKARLVLFWTYLLAPLWLVIVSIFITIFNFSTPTQGPPQTTN